MKMHKATQPDRQLAGAKHTAQLQDEARASQADTRSGASTLQRFQQLADNSPQALQLRQRAALTAASPAAIALQRFQQLANGTAQLMPSGSQGTIQRQRIGKVDVYVESGYPIWEQGGVRWHLTMKDRDRWHITKSDRSMSYWFTVDAGTVTPTKPKKAEFGGHKEKHKSLDDAPDDVKDFVIGNITAIISVTDEEP